MVYRRHDDEHVCGEEEDDVKDSGGVLMAFETYSVEDETAKLVGEE